MKDWNIRTNNWKIWLKRFVIYLCGLFVMAIGVNVSVKSALGVSPVTCLANVTHQITKIPLGTCTTATYCFYILIELIILRKDFKASMLLQIVASFLFGFLVTQAGNLFSFLPTPSQYWQRFLYLICSIPLIAFGVMLYLAPAILPTPGEGLSLALSKKLNKSVAVCKIIVDCCLVIISAIVSQIFFKDFVGVREGTVIAALTVGVVMKQMMRVCQKPLLRFVERETKLDKAIGDTEAAGSDTGRMILSISREFGADGLEIARRLAKKLGIPFYYDEQLIPLEAAESGLSEEFIRKHEQSMQHSTLLYDFTTAGYAMYNDGELPPLERLFAAQTRVLRKLAAEQKACVVVGRCADYILYDDPASFRVFIHANPEHRTARIADRFHIGEAQARAELKRTDAARARYYRQFTHREWGDRKFFHLSVDSGALGQEGSVELIAEAVELWQKQKEKSE